MGKITSETTIHFSHQHPLQLINHQTPHHTTCEGCQLPPSGSIYSCTTCPFFLHKRCFDMPKKITHPCHMAHPFTLLSTPAHGSFNCNACGENGTGFSYHCKPCMVDLHILCAAMPLSVQHAFHGHKLDLTFKSPYAPMNFSCDICKTDGSYFSNHWLYRCDSCGFDAHLKCARSPPPPTNFTTNHQARSIQPTPHGFIGQHQYAHYPTQPNTFVQPSSPNMATGYPAANPFAVNNELMAQQAAILQHLMNNNPHFAQSIRGNGAAGVEFNRGLQQWMQVLNPGGGVGGGGIPGLMVNELGGGGGTGFSQLLGGGNGLDLSSLLGGGGGTGFSQLLGGGNGLDFSGLLGGGSGLDLSSLLGGGGGIDLGGLLGGFSS